MKITYKDLYHDFSKVKKDELFSMYVDRKFEMKFSSNFLLLHQSLSDDAFISIEKMYLEYLLRHHRYNSTIVLATNEPLSNGIQQYAQDHEYSVNIEEIYMTKPKDFLRKNALSHTAVTIAKVDEQTVAAFLHDEFMQAEKYGTSYATFYANHFVKKQLADPRTQVHLAMLGDKIVGSVRTHQHKSFLELDAFAVHPNYRDMGIGTALQRRVMQLAHEMPVALVTDGGGRARLMYQRQGYILQNFQYTLEKQLRDIE